MKEISAYSISAVLGAGLVAGFNPLSLGNTCLFGCLSPLFIRKETRACDDGGLLLPGHLHHVLFGLGMQRLLETEAVADSFRYILTVFLLLAGLSQVWDGIRLQNGKHSMFRTDWALPYFRAGVDKGRYSSYFLIGALFSLVKAPCVGAIYPRYWTFYQPVATLRELPISSSSIRGAADPSHRWGHCIRHES